MSDLGGVSVLTMAYNRTRMLRHLTTGLARQTAPPAELIVCRPGGEDPRASLPPTGFPVRVIDIDARGGGADRASASGDAAVRLPYSQARNTAAAEAAGDIVVFLDADCIPGPAFVASVSGALAATDGIAIGPLYYLPPGVPRVPGDAGADAWAFDDLRAAGRMHPARPRGTPGRVDRDDRYELIWGLCIAMRRSTFHRLGGFHTGYDGYAGEDTDLAFTARRAGVPMLVVGDAVVFHQHHGVYEPPVQQMRATVSNAARFRRRWGEWPMRGWLAAFRDMGLIEWRPQAEDVQILRDPSPEEVSAARREAALPFRLRGDSCEGSCDVSRQAGGVSGAAPRPDRG